MGGAAPPFCLGSHGRARLGRGNDSDMNRYAPKASLTNPVGNRGPYHVKTVQAVKDGTWKSEAYLGSIAEGMVDIAPLGTSVPADVLVMTWFVKGVEGKIPQ